MNQKKKIKGSTYLATVTRSQPSSPASTAASGPAQLTVSTFFFLRTRSSSVEHSQALDPPPLLQCSRWRPPTSAPYKTFPAARGTLELHHFLSLSPVSTGDETLAPAMIVAVARGHPESH
jgi:hypothetical protein